MSEKNGSGAEQGRRDVLGVLGATGVLALLGCGSTSELHSGGGTGGKGKGSGGDGSAAGGATDGSGGEPSGDGGTSNAAGGASSGSGGMTSAGGAPSGAGGRATTDGGAPPTACLVRPQQTEGPYFIDERLNRSDIRTDPTDGSVSAGAELLLELGVFRVDGSACVAVPNALVDLWQCDAEGIYAGVVDGQFNTVGRKFLRGYQMTDAFGVVRFVTIYPGWYTGRTVHLHFKVRLDPAAPTGFQFTSQLYFDDAVTDEVALQPPYSSRGARTTRNAQDGIFTTGGSALVLDVRRDAQRYTTRFDLGLQAV